MMIPLLLFFVLGFAGYKLGVASKKQQLQIPQVATSGISLGLVRARPDSYVRELHRRVTVGAPVTRWLVNEATREAFERGDWKAVSAIARRFPRGSRVSASPLQTTETPEGPEAPADAAPQTASVPSGAGGAEDPQGTQISSSPLEAVDLEEWGDFVHSMRTRNPGYKTDRYVGQFEHNRSRLHLLGIEEPTTPSGEYEAFAADMKTLDEENGPLIAEFSGEVVDIGGQPVPVTRSGILGLLKAAGPENARSWLTTESDRKAFPRTTATFERSNGVF